MTKEQRLEIISEAKELGLKSVTIEGIVYEFGDDQRPPPHFITQEEAETSYAQLSTLDGFTEDEITYWATPYYDEIQAKKLIREQQLKDKE